MKVQRVIIRVNFLYSELSLFRTCSRPNFLFGELSVGRTFACPPSSKRQLKHKNTPYHWITFAAHAPFHRPWLQFHRTYRATLTVRYEQHILAFHFSQRQMRRLSERCFVRVAVVPVLFVTAARETETYLFLLGTKSNGKKRWKWLLQIVLMKTLLHPTYPPNT